MDQPERSLPHLLRATEWPHSWGLLTYVYFDMGEFQKVLEASRKAIEHFPSSVDIRLIRARAARNLELRDEQLETLEQALKVSPSNGEIKTDLALYHYVYGEQQVALNYVDEAIKDYDHALSLEPKLLALYRDNAEAQYWLGWPEDALDTLDKALTIDPGDERAFGILTKVTCHLARLSEE